MTTERGFRAGAVNVKHKPERRVKPRIQGPISAHVKGAAADGGAFDLEASLDNLSTGGLYVRLDRPVLAAAELSFIIRLPSASGSGAPGMRFAARGVVRRVEACPDGLYGLGVEFTGHHQIYNGQS